MEKVWIVLSKGSLHGGTINKQFYSSLADAEGAAGERAAKKPGCCYVIYESVGHATAPLVKSPAIERI